MEEKIKTGIHKAEREAKRMGRRGEENVRNKKRRGSGWGKAGWRARNLTAVSDGSGWSPT